MDAYLNSVERAADRARDDAEREEEVRFDVQPTQEQDAVLAFLDGMTPREFSQDSSEILLLPGGESTWVQFHDELLEILTMDRELKAAGCINGRAKRGIQLLDLLQANIERYVEATA